MSIFKNANSKSKYYVVCPAYFKTGGTELMHQLVNELIELSLDVYMVYVNTVPDNKKHTPLEFEKYKCVECLFTEIEDNKENIIIVPEMNSEILKQFKNLQKCIWWLSVDNYMVQRSLKYAKSSATSIVDFLSLSKKIMLGKVCGKYSIKDMHRAEYHLCQSYYAIDFLKKKNIKNIHYLSDYINDTFINKEISYNDRDDIALYNPRKGSKFTQKIIDATPDINWVALRGLTTQQVSDYLSKGKVYIDFGHHPGKDRFPREAAISGCCVITGKRGAAAFNNDVGIPDKYKFNDMESEVPNIAIMIESCIKKYDSLIEDFSEYRAYICCEKNKFKSDIRRIFG